MSVVLSSDCFADVDVFFHCRNLLSPDVRISYYRGRRVVIILRILKQLCETQAADPSGSTACVGSEVTLQ